MSSNKKWLFVVFLGLGLSTFSFAHEGHDHSAPGAIPAGVNGGKAIEAEYAKDQKPTSTDELFYEISYKNGVATIYPQILSTSDTKNFKPLSPKELKNVEVAAKNGRTQKLDKLAPNLTEGTIEVSYTLKGSNHGALIVSAEHAGVIKKATLPISRK